MPVTNLANLTLEPRYTQARKVGVYSAAHPSDGCKATVGPRGPPLVIPRPSCGWRMSLSQQFVK